MSPSFEFSALLLVGIILVAFSTTLFLQNRRNRQLTQEIESLKNDQGRLIRMICHDFRNIISVLRLSLSGPGVSSEDQEVSDRATLDMEDILDRCFYLDQLERQTIKLEKKPLHLVSIIHQLLEGRSYRDRIKIHTIKNTPEIHSSKLAVGYILLNLIDNAARYSKEGTDISVVVSSSGYEQSESPELGNYVCVAIENEIGPVGTPEPQELFKKFYRGHRAKSQMGFGLGLHVSDGFARAISAKITYLLIEDKIRFELWIPL